MARNNPPEHRGWRDEPGSRNQGRDESADLDYDYRYTRDDEGDSSVRAGAYDQGRAQYSNRRGAVDQSRYGQDRGEERPSQGGYGQRGYSQRGYGERGQGERSGRNVRDSHGEGHDAGHRQGGYGGDYGEGRYGEGGSRSRFANFGERGPDRYSQGTFGTERGDLGQHRGKGPKGYQRSDERLREMVCERLREDPEIDASEVTVTVVGGRVTLDGSVDTRRTKYLVEDAAEQLGVDDVQNNLRVGPARGATSSLAGEESGQAKQKRN